MPPLACPLGPGALALGRETPEVGLSSLRELPLAGAEATMGRVGSWGAGELALLHPGPGQAPLCRLHETLFTGG